MAALKALIHLNRDNLKILIPGKEPVSVTFSEKSVDDLQVKDSKHLKKDVTKAVIAAGLKPKNALIVLGEDLLFTKTTSAKTPEKRDKAIRDFLEEIPFEPNTVVHKNFNSSKGITVVAAHNSVYMGVMKALKEQGWKIRYVVPASILGKIDAENIKQILKDKKKLVASNFYTFENKEINSTWKIAIGIFLTLLVVGGAYYFINNANVNNEKTEELIEMAPVVEEVIEEEIPIEEEEIPIVEKSEITIQVLNGSGVPGQAGATQELLLDIGFENVEVGNADNQDYQNTILTFDKNVPNLYTEEIGDLLKETYENVLEDTPDEDDTINYDIVIITGDLITSN